jgi:hypothetical protein
MIQGRWIPQSEAEWQLLEDLHAVSRLAATEGVEKDRIASLMAFMAAAASDQAGAERIAENGAQSREQGERNPADPVDDDSPPDCPSCEEALTHFSGGLGTPRCPSCGSIIESSELIEEVIE